MSQKSSQRTALAHSLGCAILLASIDTYKPQPGRVILHAPFSSLREICVLFGYADSSWAWMIPDLWNNTKNISKTSNIPTCIVHSKTDEVVPFSMVEKISKNSKSAKLMTTDGYHHNALQIDLDSAFWRQILDCNNN